jgi:Mg/Co/Ni transporter MgtE
MTQRILNEKRREVVAQVTELPPRERLKVLRALVRELKQLEAINEMGRNLKRRGIHEQDLVRLALDRN